MASGFIQFLWEKRSKWPSFKTEKKTKKKYTVGSEKNPIILPIDEMKPKNKT